MRHHRTRSWIVGCCLQLLLVCGPAAAQTPAERAAAGEKFLTANQFPNALAQFLAIPDTADLEHRLTKHSGATLSLGNMGRVNEAVPHVEAAKRIAEQIGTDVALAKALNAEGRHLTVMRSGDRGLASLHRAAALAERAGARSALGAIYGSLSAAYQFLEDFDRQAYYNQKAFDLVPSPTPIQRFTYHITRGISFFEMYERDLAEAEFTRALALSAETGRVRDRAFALGELAFLHWTFDRDAPKALPLYAEGIELAAQSKTAALEAQWRNNRGNVYRDTGDYPRAEADYRDSIRVLEIGGQTNSTFSQWKNIGQVWRLTGRTREAVELLERLIHERGQSALPRHLWQAHMELASSLATMGQPDRAEAQFRTMLEVLEEQRETRILDAFRSGSLAHALHAYDPYERFIRFLLDQSPPREAEALEIAERARARGFLEALASVRGAVAARVPAPLLAEEARIARAISAAQEQLRAADLPKPDRTRLVGELERAEQERDQFILNLRVEHPALAEARYPTLLDIGAIQAALRPQEIVVAFFLAEPHSFRWVLSSEHVVFDRIAGRKAIEDEVARLRALLRAPTAGGEVKAVSATLGGMLFDGLTTADGRPMVVVPHGALHYVPFEVMTLQGRMLIERHPVSYAQSLNALVQLRRLPANDAPFRVLAVGNPTIRNQESGIRNQGSADRAGDVENLALLGPLPFAEQELHAIGRTFPDRTRILSGASARESDLRDAGLSRYPVLHFATHGLVSDVQPKRSGLLLAPEAGEDGLLQMSEIYGLGLHANLVVLSACQTALGREITGEGLIGLSRAFFYAGARSVMAALWNLNDRFAAEFVQRFYRELNDGHAAEEALRRAKLAYVNHPRYSHPYYWSSLVALGDASRPLVVEAVRPPVGSGILAALFGLFALVLAVAKLRKTGKNRPISAAG